jgi:hypothetical protein
MGSPWGVKMLYCPNCSAYQHEENAVICRKCGYDMAAHIERKSHEAEKVNREKKEVEERRLKDFNQDCPCPVCSAPTRGIDEDIELIHEGGRINMYGLKLMGGEITKRTLSQYRMSVTGIECCDGHRFYIDVSSRRRALCPLCQEPLMEYGSSLYSCTRCDRHFSMADWEFPAEGEVLERSGWIKAE